jgi:ATP-dependent helicase/nuclease subunit A
MAETPAGVWLVDYKMGAPRADRRPTYAAQLALYRAAVAQLYPGKPVRCFLIHALGPVVSEIEAAELDSALSDAMRGIRAKN